MIAFAILMPTTLGVFIVTALSSKDSGQNFTGLLSLGFGVGMGLVTYIIFIISLFDIPFSFTMISSIQTVLAVMLLTATIRSGFPAWTFSQSPAQAPPLKYSKSKVFIVSLLTVWLFLKLIFVIHENTLWPVHGWDSWTNWSSGAKYFFYERGLNLNPQDEYFFGKGYRTFLAYPIHIPLMQVWVSLCIGEIHEAHMKIWSAFYFIAIIGLLYSSVKRESNHLIALIASLLLAGVPLLTYHGTSAYADLPLSYYSLASTVCLWQCIRSSKNDISSNYKMLALTGLFSGLCIWTKVEGLFFALSNAFVLFIYLVTEKKPIKEYLVFMIPIFAITVPWFIFLYVSDISLDRGNVLSSGLHFELFPVLWEQTMFSANFNIIFIFIFVMIGMSIRMILRTKLKYLIASLILVILQYLFIYITTESYTFAINMMALNRSIMTFIPSMYFIASILTIYELKQTKPGIDMTSKKRDNGLPGLCPRMDRENS